MFIQCWETHMIVLCMEVCVFKGCVSSLERLGSTWSAECNTHKLEGLE